MSYYQKRKEEARQRAIEWQADFARSSLSWGVCCEVYSIFCDLAKRYGLTREFKENGII